MHTNEIRQLRSYRATLIPKDLDRSEFQGHAADGKLPTIQLKAASADRAQAAAHHTTGLAVLCVDRVGGGE